MKSFLKLVLSVSTLLLTLIFPASLLAQNLECSNFSVTPGSGDINTTFTFTATCNNTSPIGIPLYIEDEDGDTTLSTTVTIPASGELSQEIVPIEGGTFSASLLDPNLNQIAGPITFTVTESSTVRKTCCSVTADSPNFCSELPDILANETNCIVPDNNPTNCPSLCQPIIARSVCSGSGEVWLCAASRSGHPSLCENNGLTGIDSAIGCIPFETASLTTAFFLRWALGIGGGIALFTISISAIRIMTVKDDPKRVQDAKDMLSSAIAGLVLLILSVFLVRFLSETLLNLF